MATTPNASPSTANVTGTGTTATTSTIKLTANSAATLAASQTAIKQATGNAPANTFAVGSTTSISQTTPGGKFVQGSTTTPALNAAAAASPPATNNGVSSVLSVQNILGAAALATGGLAVFNAVSGGINLSSSLVNNSNTATPVSSTNNVQDPAQRAQAAAAIPSTGSTNNVSDPAQRAQAAAQAQDTNVNSDTTTLSDAETSQLFAVDEDPFAAAEATVSDEEVAQQLQAARDEVAENKEPRTPSDEEVAAAIQEAQAEVVANKEPRQPSDEEVAAAIQEAQAEVVANKEPRQPSDEEVDAAIQAAKDEAIENDAAANIAADEANAGGGDYVENFDPAPVDEFAGVDQQVADNTYIDQPATLTDEEVNQQLQAAQDENIENKEPRQPSDEEVDAAIQAAKDEAIENDAAQDIEDPNDPPPDEEVESDDPQDGADQSGFNGATGQDLNTQSQATQQDEANFAAKRDWRVRLRLAPGAPYLYNANPPGILAPLQATDGVIFPYTPAISVQYNASYDPTELTHSNYKFFTYRSSAVDSVTIGCDFTAQDTFEAQYLLAVIHFFRSVTKMFYGQDQNPKNGTPPPLCYLTGLGAFQFDEHPLAITGFTYTLPTDVDYIKAGSTATPAGVNKGNSPAQGKPGGSGQASASRMNSSGINPGATVAPPDWQTETGTKEPTYVPTKISLSITAVPIVTRNDISNEFSLREYATGALLRGTRRAGGGIW